MSYLVLARKWRPKTFDEVIGQEYITKTLKNAISRRKIAHALIFSGPRGVGKTSTARIVAKALNCEKGPTPEPCSECGFCREISEGRSLDVIEIDAASHTSVNDIREIIDNVKYLPSSGKTKIYIIDEAHMLSQSAFNALLKTLEEPPPHVLFILATTEIHKIPATILSRCQRYDFKRVSAEKIRKRLEEITSIEGIEVPRETLYLISKEADGSLRDALSMLDQLVATFGTTIKPQEATEVLGLFDRSLVKVTLEAVFSKDPKKSIEALHSALEKGINPKRFAEELLKTIRDALVLKVCEGENLPDISTEEIKDLEKISSNRSIEELEMMFDLMLRSTEEIQRSLYPTLALESTLVKLSLIQDIVKIGDIIEKIDRLQEAEKEYGKSKGDREAGGIKHGPDTYTEETKLTTEESNHIGDFIRLVKSKKPITGTHLEHASKIQLDNSTLLIEFDTPSIHSDYLMRQDAQESLKRISREFFSKDLRVKIYVKSSDPGVREPSYLTKKENIRKEPAVKDAIEIFGGKIIKIKTKEKE